MRKTFRLRQIAVLVVVTPVVLTATAMALFGRSLLRKAETNVLETIFANVNQSIGAQAEIHFHRARRLQEEFAQRAAIALMPLDDHDEPAADLAERLRSLEGFAWLSWGEERSGRFVGARRREDGAIIIDRYDPAVCGVPREYIANLDGSREPIESEHPPYDPRNRAWYQTDAERTNLIWTLTTQFHEGREGITMAKAIHDQTGKLIGVFTVDIFAEQIAQFLDSLRAGQIGVCFVGHEDGALILPRSLPNAARRAFHQMHKLLLVDGRDARAGGAIATRLARTLHEITEELREIRLGHMRAKSQSHRAACARRSSYAAQWSI